MENTQRTTHNLAAVLLETSARINNKAETIAENVEVRGPSQAASAVEIPAAFSANDILNRAVDNLLRLENTLDRINESVGSVYQPDTSAKQVAIGGAAIGGQTLARR